MFCNYYTRFSIYYSCFRVLANPNYFKNGSIKDYDSEEFIKLHLNTLYLNLRLLRHLKTFFLLKKKQIKNKINYYGFS